MHNVKIRSPEASSYCMLKHYILSVFLQRRQTISLWFSRPRRPCKRDSLYSVQFNFNWTPVKFRICARHMRNTKYYISSKHLVLITVQCMKFGKTAFRLLLKVVCCIFLKNELGILNVPVCYSINWSQTLSISNSCLLWKN